MFGLNQKEVLDKMKQSLEESKQKLAQIRVCGEAGSGLVKIELDGNRKLTNLEINADLSAMDKEELEDFLALALDQAMTQANQVNEAEVAASARHFMPGL